MTTMTLPMAHTDTVALVVPEEDVQPLHTVCIPPVFTDVAVCLESFGLLDGEWRTLGEMSDESGDYTTFVGRRSYAGTIQYGIEITI